MEIKIDNLQGAEIANLLEEHLSEMYAVSPPESVHALDLDKLRRPEITFWSIWDSGKLAGCVALKELNTTHGEIKSMRTAQAFRGRGIAKKLLQHLIETAQLRGYQHLSLETGSEPFFNPARKLYAAFGFEICAPFADYQEDPNSVFMRKTLIAAISDTVNVQQENACSEQG